MISKWRFFTMWALAAVILLGIGMCKVANAENFNNILLNQTSSKQKQILSVAVNSAGFDCSNPSRAYFQGWDGGTGFWNVQCSEGAYSVMIGPDSSNKSMPCVLMQAITKVPCFTPLD